MPRRVIDEPHPDLSSGDTHLGPKCRLLAGASILPFSDVQRDLHQQGPFDSPPCLLACTTQACRPYTRQARPPVFA